MISIEDLVDYIIFFNNARKRLLEERDKEDIEGDIIDYDITVQNFYLLCFILEVLHIYQYDKPLTGEVFKTNRFFPTCAKLEKIFKGYKKNYSTVKKEVEKPKIDKDTETFLNYILKGLLDSDETGRDMEILVTSGWFWAKATDEQEWDDKNYKCHDIDMKEAAEYYSRYFD